jgi:hypothetical protein
MEITIETYGDGHREITIDGKRYWVKEKRNFQLSSMASFRLSSGRWPQEITTMARPGKAATPVRGTT